LTSISSRVLRKEGARMVDADHYSWEEMYSLLGCEAEIESLVDY